MNLLIIWFDITYAKGKVLGNFRPVCKRQSWVVKSRNLKKIFFRIDLADEPVVSVAKFCMPIGAVTSYTYLGVYKSKTDKNSFVTRVWFKS